MVRRFCPFVSVVLLGLWLSTSSQARYIRPDLEQVPVDRLITNIEKMVEKNPKDVQARFNLARVHAMAYAAKTDTTPVRKDRAGKLEDRAWFGYEPKHIPFTPKSTDDAAKNKTAQAHLGRAINLYKETVKFAPDHLSARLGLAWCLEQAKDTMAAIKEYRAVIDAGWKKEKDMKSAPLGWHSVTAEAAGYLAPLLDAAQDKDEIQTLKDRSEKLRRIPRPITPLVVPLRDGLQAQDLVDLDARVTFDADGSGQTKTWSWIKPEAGWLVYDHQGKKQIASALQMFGNVSFWLFWENGYRALAALDADGDGLLTGAELAGLAIWNDMNANGICDPGEVKSLAAWHIVALSCRHEVDSRHPDRIVFSPHGVVFGDGRTRPTFDIILHPR